MESAIPSSNVPTTIIPQNNPAKAQRNRFVNAPRGFFYYFGFLSLLAGLVLSIIALTKDELTQVTFYSSNAKLFTEYCGWHNVHFDNSQTQAATDLHPYSDYCSGNNKACRLVKSGRGWYALLIIAVVLQGLALIVFIFDFSFSLAFVTILLLEFLFFLCMLAAVLTWGISDGCATGCKTLHFPYTNIGTATSCRSQFAVSWILGVIAGGFALISILSLIIYRLMLNKNY